MELLDFQGLLSGTLIVLTYLQASDFIEISITPRQHSGKMGPMEVGLAPPSPNYIFFTTM